MHQNIWWRAFLCVIMVITLGFTVVAAYRYQVYTSLSGSVKAIQMDWEIEELSENAFILKTAYQYEVNNEKYSGKHVWEDIKYLNRYASEEAVEDAKKEMVNVWYNPQKPQNSTLERSFPF